MATSSGSTTASHFTTARRCTGPFSGNPAAKAPRYGRSNLVLYFEDDDIDAAFQRIAGRVAPIHDVRRQAWGQRVFRFFDSDGHIVEIGESHWQPDEPASSES